MTHSDNKMAVTSYDKLSTYVAFKPMMFSLKIIGLHFVHINSNKATNSSYLLISYCCLIMIITWISAGLNASAFLYINSVNPALFGTLTSFCLSRNMQLMQVVFSKLHTAAKHCRSFLFASQN